MASRSIQNKQLSRSKIELFLECPRCFHEDVVKANPRPGGFPMNLNNAVDALFKREFDHYRELQQPHPLFATVGLNAVPLKDDRMDEWRANFRGVRWTDPDTGWTLFGAVDDLWLDDSCQVLVADYKATSKADEITPGGLHPAYRRQAEVYQFLVEQQDFPVSNRAWFVYTNGIRDTNAFGDLLHFRTVLVHHDGSRDWVLPTFRQAVALVEQAAAPASSENCKFCTFALRRGPD